MVLPFLLTAAIVGFDHLVRRMGRATLPSGVVPAQVLFLAAAAILTHPILDTLNTYGVRWLMPFSGRWFYGDTLYIVDPWLWLILGIGFFLSGHRHRTRRFSEWTARPASVALTVTAGYIVVMAFSGWLARKIAAEELTKLTGENVEALMVAPVPFNPFVRTVVAAQRNSYRATEFRWLHRPHLDVASLKSYPRGGPQGPAVTAAVATPLGKRFLGWARFPVFEVESGPNGSALVHMIDLRYANQPGKGFGTVTIPVEVPATSGSSSDSLSAFPATWLAAPRH